MTEGKRVRVHDEGRTFALGPGLFQIAQIGPEAVAAVLHEDKGILHPGDLVEAEVAEKTWSFSPWCRETGAYSPARTAPR